MALDFFIVPSAMLRFQFSGSLLWRSNWSRALHPLPLYLLSDWVDMHPSPSRLYTSAISSCTKALCDVQWGACILIVQEQDVSQAGQHGEDMEKTSGSATQLPSPTWKLWIESYCLETDSFTVDIWDVFLYLKVVYAGMRKERDIWTYSMFMI